MKNNEKREKSENPADEREENGEGVADQEPTESSDAASKDGEIVIGVPMNEYEQLQQDLTTAQEEAQKNLDGWQRALADYNNLRRRTEQERERMRHDIVGEVLLPFLDILDDLDLAMQNRPQDDDWSAGIDLVYRKLLSKLEESGVQVMEVEGKMFDPHLHEAITHEENDTFESGQIIAVIKPGYLIGDRVLRPAKVRVAA